MSLSCKLAGGVGNKMFQIAKVLSVAHETGQDAVFDLNDSVIMQGNSGITYRDNIFSKVKEIEEGDNPIIYSEGDKYWQSEKHFINIKKYIVDYFSNVTELSRLSGKYKTILTNSVGVHVRRGDYVITGDVLDQGYYYRALNRLWETDKTENVLVFSDDIEWCQKHFLYHHPGIHYVTGLKDWEDMYLFSLCTNQVCANSSFSWWGAYLNRNKSKKVFAPKPWTDSHNDDIYFNGMITVPR